MPRSGSVWQTNGKHFLNTIYIGIRSMIMKKIFITIVLTITAISNIYAEEPFTTHKVIEYYNKALIEENETALSRLSLIHISEPTRPY